MPKLIIELDLGNDAFQQPGEIEKVLQQVGSKIAGADYGDFGSIKDSNGNTVGSYRIPNVKLCGCSGPCDCR